MRVRSWPKPVELDPAQQAALTAFQTGTPVVLSGSAGSGLTTTALAAFGAELAPEGEHRLGDTDGGGRNDLWIVPTGEQARRLQGLVSHAAGKENRVSRPVKTMAAVAFQILRQYYVEREDPLGVPKLITGAEMDIFLEELLEKQTFPWDPKIPREVIESEQFRTQLRSFLDEAFAQGWDMNEIAQVGQCQDKPNWLAGAQVGAEVNVAMIEMQRLTALMETGEIPAWQSNSATIEDWASRRDGLRLSAPGAIRLASFILRHWDDLATIERIQAARPRYTRIIVDGGQELDAAALDLLTVLCQETPTLVTNNPSVALASYRGGLALTSTELAERLNAQEFHLPGQYRLPVELAQFVDQTMDLVPIGEKHYTSARSEETRKMGEPNPQNSPSKTDAKQQTSNRQDVEDQAKALPYEAAVYASSYQEALATAAKIRELHLKGKVSYDQMAIVVRSGSQISELRSQLSEVPTRVVSQALVFSTHRLSRLMLELLAGTVDLDEVFTGPLLGVDPLSYSALVRHIGDLWQIGPNYLLAQAAGVATSEVNQENTEEASAAVDESATVAVTDQTVSDSEESFIQPSPVASALGQLKAALGQGENHSQFLERVQTCEDAEEILKLILSDLELTELFARTLYGTTLADVAEKLLPAAKVLKAANRSHMPPRQKLWDLWESAGVAEKWQEMALNGSDWADENLDAVLALMRAADLWEQANPQGSAESFAKKELESTIPSTNLASTGYRGPAVDLLTSAQVAAREYQHVFVMQLQENLWPNLRLRDSFFDTSELRIRKTQIALCDDLPFDPAARRLEKLRDEVRMFTAALTRATQKVHLSAFANENAAPSLFFMALKELATQVFKTDGSGQLQVSSAPKSFDLNGVSAHLRALSLQNGGDPKQVALQTAQLIKLAAAGVEHADWRNWPQALPLSTLDPLYQPDTEVAISPSALQSHLECPLKWFFRSVARTKPGEKQLLGTFLHSMAENRAFGDEEGQVDLETLKTDMLASLDRAWDAIGSPRETLEGQDQYEKAVEKVEVLATILAASTPVAVEAELVAKVGDNARIWGKVDRIEQLSDGRISIIDYKSGKPIAVKDAVVNPQLLAYQVAWEALPAAEKAKILGCSPQELSGQTGQVANASLYYLEKRSKEPFPSRTQPALTGDGQGELSELDVDAAVAALDAEAPTLDQARQVVHSAASSIRAGQYRTKVNNQCDRCNFKSSCPSQSQGRKLFS
ncbi:PD-(D/E)XK nuclease family protein [Boudabousia tangfeifanii]|nr:UrvD/REP family ATP-dependent DNA helicase [Boudabousia tangfeifanii]